MKTTLSLAALAVAALLLAAPASTQAMPKLDGLHQDSLVQTAAAKKKKKQAAKPKEEYLKGASGLPSGPQRPTPQY